MVCTVILLLIIEGQLFPNQTETFVRIFGHAYREVAARIDGPYIGSMPKMAYNQQTSEAESVKEAKSSNTDFQTFLLQVQSYYR